MRTAPDRVVWDYAKANGFVIASKDADFPRRAALLGHPPKVIWIRLGNCPTNAVTRLLQDRLGDIMALEADPNADFLELP